MSVSVGHQEHSPYREEGLCQWVDTDNKNNSPETPGFTSYQPPKLMWSQSVLSATGGKDTRGGQHLWDVPVALPTNGIFLLVNDPVAELVTSGLF